MRITKTQLKRMIIQEMRNIQRQKRLQEGTKSRPIKVTPAILNRIIREEYAAFKKQQRLVESRRRRAAQARRRNRRSAY